MDRYRADEEAGKEYFDFLPGLRDAATTRVPTHALEDWREDMFWMTAYFSVGAWTGILMMYAPRLSTAGRSEIIGDGSTKEELLPATAQTVGKEIAMV